MAKELSYQTYDDSWGAEPIPPTPDESLLHMLASSVQKNPDKAASILFQRVTTYQEVDRLSDRLAMFLVEAGIKKGDRVATMLPNCTQHLITFFAILKAGAIVVPFNIMLKSEEAGYILEDSGAKALFVLDLVYPGIQPRVEELGIKHTITVHIKDFSEPSATIPALLGGEKTLFESTTDFMAAIAEDRGALPEVTFQPREDLALILYTSGTTGFPKGAMVSHHNMYYSSIRFSAILGLEHDDVFFMLFPQFHIGGMVLNMLPSVLLGATILQIPMFDPPEAMRLMELHKVTLIFAPPTVYIGILNHPDFSKHDLSSLRVTGASGAPVPPAVQREWQEKVGIYLYNGYGATETTGAGPGILEMKNRKKVGCETLGSTMGELKIVDEEGNTVLRGTVGEFMLRGPGVVRGYWNKPEETEKEFTGDGWWHSGDAGYMDDEGFVYFVERIKDLIIASGYNIAPVEVENHLYKHPAVLEVSVIGVQDAYRGETVKAIIVLKDEHKDEVTEEEILQFCRDNMAAYKAPKIVQFVDELPKTATGKILRRILRDKYTEE